MAFFAGQPELGVAIWAVNIINGIFSFWQEYRAERATSELKKMLASHARVERDGSEQRILSDDLVPGDIMILAEGDRISADARLVAGADLQVDQSTLTGESSPLRKTLDAILVGTHVSALTAPGEIQVVSIERGARAFIPIAGTAVHDGDILCFAVMSASKPRLRSMLGQELGGP